MFIIFFHGTVGVWRIAGIFLPMPLDWCSRTKIVFFPESKLNSWYVDAIPLTKFKQSSLNSIGHVLWLRLNKAFFPPTPSLLQKTMICHFNSQHFFSFYFSGSRRFFFLPLRDLPGSHLLQQTKPFSFNSLPHTHNSHTHSQSKKRAHTSYYAFLSPFFPFLRPPLSSISFFSFSLYSSLWVAILTGFFFQPHFFLPVITISTHSPHFYPFFSRTHCKT